MTIRTTAFGSIGVTLAAGVAVFLAFLIPAAADAAPTKTYDGEGFSVKPDRLSGWTAFGGEDSDPVLISGRAGSPQEGLGPIEWDFWKKTKAVGKGAGWADTCARPCRGSFPWDGSNLRVTLYRKRAGHFTKMIVFARGPSGSAGNFTMKLSYRAGEWRVTSVDDRARNRSTTRESRSSVRPVKADTTVRPKETLLYHSNGFAIRPAIFTGWVADGNGEDLPLIGGRTYPPGLNFGSIHWNFWREKKAVGKGAGWATSCRDRCESAFPFDGSKMRIAAYEPRAGHFTRVKIRIADPYEHFFAMRLKYIGPQDDGVAWKVTKVVDRSRD